MAKSKMIVIMRSSELNALMRSAPVQQLVDDVGESMASTSRHLEYVSLPHRWVARGYVKTIGRAGAHAQRRGAILERAMGAASKGGR